MSDQIDESGDAGEPQDESVGTIEQAGNSNDPFDQAAASDYEPRFQNDLLNDYVRRAISPIAGDHPCGESEDAASSVISQIETTGDGIHESLRVAFGDAVRDDNLQIFEMASAGRDADPLIDQIVDCLSEKCKSIVLACYLPQLMLIMYGPEGFEAGLTVIREITLRYGSRAWPCDNERLGGFLRRGVYIGNDDKVTDNYKLFLYTSITEPGNLPYALLRNARLKGADSVEVKYADDARSSSVAFYVQFIGSLERAVEAAKSANQALGELLGDPTFEVVSYSFVESLERMTSMVRGLATSNCDGYPPPDQPEATTDGDADPAAPASSAPATPPPQAASGEIIDRDHAIKMLGKIADFFYKTERHSPISYRIRDTIEWCKMDFPELLQMLLDGDQGSLNEMQKRIGFEVEDDDD